MAASYPASIPALLTAGATLATNPHSTLHNRMSEEVVAIATELGTDVSGAYATFNLRMEAAEWPATSGGYAVNQSTSNIAKTVNYSKYWRQKKSIFWMFKYSMTAAGSAGTAITLSLPVTAYSASGLLGTALYRTGSTSYTCALYGTSTTAVKLIDGSTNGNGLGSAPSLAIASGHTIQGFIKYEAAT